MNPDRCAVHTAHRFQLRAPRSSPASVVQNKPVRGERDRLTDIRRGETFGQSGRGCIGGLFTRAREDEPAHLVNPAIICLTRARLAAMQLVGFEELRQETADRGLWTASFGVDTETNRLAQ